MPYIPYGRQDINESDIQSVIDVLTSDFLTQGPKVPLFEELVSSYCNSKHSIAVNSATSALHIACLALEVGPNDYVWTTPITFVASANCALYCGASVDFVDINPNTYNLDIQSLEKKLELAQQHGKLPKVLVPVHLSGEPCDMQAIKNLSNKYGFRIIEDASHAVGGKYLDQVIGSCKYCDITVFSFHPVKIITTAEGGLATTNSPELAAKMELFRSHGVTRNPELMTSKSDGDWYYQQVALGYNYRMTELQAALGISQLKRLDEFVSKRHSLADRYDELLSDVPVTTPVRSDDSYSGLHLYIIRIDSSKYIRKDIFNKLRERGIGVNIHYIPVHTQPYYNKLGFNKGDFPAAEKYYSEAISIPMYSSLTEKDQDKVVSVLKDSLM